MPRLGKSFFVTGWRVFSTATWRPGRAILRDYINATIGFQELGELTNHSPKSLMRMLGPSGNPNARNLFEILCALQEEARVHFKLKTFAAVA